MDAEQIKKTEQINTQEELKDNKTEQVNDFEAFDDDFIKLAKAVNVKAAPAQKNYESKYEGLLLNTSYKRSQYMNTFDVRNDTVSLGSKTLWKTKAGKAKNARIDAGRTLTSKATKYTEQLYNDVTEYASKNGELSDQHEERNEALETVLYERISQIHFTSKMVTSTYILNNFKQCLDMIYSYDRLLKIYEDNIEDEGVREMSETIKANMGEQMALFKKRVSYFAKQNRVDIFGKGKGKNKDTQAKYIMDKHANIPDNEVFSDEDLLQWQILSDSAKTKRVGDRRRQVLSRENTKERENRQNRLDEIDGRINELETLLKSPTANKESKSDARRELMELNVEKNYLRLDKAYMDKSSEDVTEDEKEDLFRASEELYKLRRRREKLLNNTEEILKRTMPSGMIKMDRREALSNESDRLSYQARLKLVSVAKELKKYPQYKGLYDSVMDYYNGNVYKVGVAEEAKLCKRMAALAKNTVGDEPELIRLKEEIDKLTNGNLTIPEGKDVLDCSRSDPENIEITKDFNRAHKRNKVLFGFSKKVDMTDEPLFAHEPTINDLRQGKVSNCWMVAGATDVINYDPNIIKDCMKDNGDGTVTVRLYKPYYDGFESYAKPIYVRVKKEIPRLVTGGAIHTSGALWMNILERAVAFIGMGDKEGTTKKKGYEALWYASSMEMVFMLTGAPNGSMISTIGGINEPVNAFGDLSRFAGKMADDPELLDAVFDRVVNAKKNKEIINYGSRQSQLGGAAGMNDGHAYSVIGGVVDGGQRYVILRNPYGNMNLEYDKKGKISRTDSYFSSEMNETFGQFRIKLEDFVKNSSGISYSKVSQTLPEPPNELVEKNRLLDESYIAERKNGAKTSVEVQQRLKDKEKQKSMISFKMDPNEEEFEEEEDQPKNKDKTAMLDDSFEVHDKNDF